MNSIISGHIVLNHGAIRPMVPIELTSIVKKKSQMYIGWIDSGATNSVICKKVADNLQLWEEGEVEIALADGNTGVKKAYSLKFRISGTDGSELEDSFTVTVADQEYKGYDLLIGLDILQHANFNYDGLNQKFELVFPPKTD